MIGNESERKYCKLTVCNDTLELPDWQTCIPNSPTQLRKPTTKGLHTKVELVGPWARGSEAARSALSEEPQMT